MCINIVRVLFWGGAREGHVTSHDKQVNSPAHLSQENMVVYENYSALSLILTGCCVVITTLLFFTLYTCKRKKVKGCREKLVILFIDAPDPDNPACALAIWNTFLPHTNSAHVHIVITGRPVDLRTGKTFKDDKQISDQIPRQNWEVTVESHGQYLLQDSAARISNFLNAFGLYSNSFTMYNGGVAPSAPISDVVHDWDFLFDRKDLITNNDKDQGKIVTTEEYKHLVQKYNLLSGEEREAAFLSLLREYNLTPLSKLREELNHLKYREVCVFLGGPATAVVELFKGEDNTGIRDKVTQFYGMFGALYPGKNTLIDNQFNAACDIESAVELFLGNMFPNVRKYLIPTETAKQPDLIIGAGELEMRSVKPYIVELMKLWESTHRGKPQPLFDVLPVMASLPQYNNVFNWTRKKVVIQDWTSCLGEINQRFMFIDCETGNILVSNNCYSSDRQTYIQFLESAFKHNNDT